MIMPPVSDFRLPGDCESVIDRLAQIPHSGLELGLDNIAGEGPHA